MPGDDLKKVSRGQPLRIPAVAYNSFIDAAVDFRNRTMSLGKEDRPKDTKNGIVYVKNGTGDDQPQFAVLGLTDVLIYPDDNEPEFLRQVAFLGEVPNLILHRGRFAILAEPLAADKIGLAYVDGICPVLLNVPDDTYEPNAADIDEGETGALKAVTHGAAAILWRQGGMDVQWAVVRLGKPPMVFPVLLQETGGSAGNATNPATWEYDIVDFFTRETLEWSVNPVDWPHQWKRPQVGFMYPAEFGYAHYDDQGNIVLGWINELMGQEPCYEA